MQISVPAKNVAESVTLKLNAKAVKMAEEGRQIYNLTAGQLPIKPAQEFIESLKVELNFLKSFQYGPSAGLPELRSKLIKYIEVTREIDFSKAGEIFDCVISSGAKHSITNIFAAMINPGDKVVILSPYWISYPVIVQLFRGVPLVVKSNLIDGFIPSMSDIEKRLKEGAKAIILNSPNNPAGIHYSAEWMKDLAQLLLKYPNVTIVSDEIYYELYYFDPRPRYFYQFEPSLLKRTIIIDGISKSFASTGLRIGFCVGPKSFLDYVSRLQGQTTSCANSLTQRALLDFDFNTISQFLRPIKELLRQNSYTIRDTLKANNLEKIWYQPNSAFYYMIDLSATPVFERFVQENKNQREVDYGDKICDELLEKYGVAIVPGNDFGLPNFARISHVLDKRPFAEAMEKLSQYLINK
ncbi:MAG: hypothetical protein A2504_03175 [Bdellovibrionales bacterium RIFOXYD12_FULL_39_22]|nr:MAG: hypothetical protein A2385_15585 [Bdellovibrionales bacterium RIFOXYB1_FULL_39_21]OFZ41530.1 MAG: hypothetical protein A2485_02275 [Bdellovibrionales bacterium RIFOXYC12_FULL_39_17]OFZ45843.1 MAG: hypothetical protein A2404_12640 [Bdellovibrionales bacterium RIFOXYC1_FULL_39_130]OFZ74774.1 MAG: hypothetical protein A2560_10070 [Bdellovibrionales bacterium RIFOXYD1_FULL_39_84]OFZ92635.1 MAG: hypothetical protein A2504_03175 [Bdellovibrionales bacterium RIFOXYD12_FULL_39_22]HLE11320.1 am